MAHRIASSATRIPARIIVRPGFLLFRIMSLPPFAMPQQMLFSIAYRSVSVRESIATLSCAIRGVYEKRPFPANPSQICSLEFIA